MRTSWLLLLLCLALPTGAEETNKRGADPAVNAAYRDPDLRVGEWMQRFETESRELYHKRHEILRACQVKPGMAVADIGAGTGLFTMLFSEATGEQGWVYAVDIAPNFLVHIRARAEKEGRKNISAVLAPGDAASLPPDSVDVVFLCDVYHHFEKPEASLGSIVRAMRSGAHLVVVDFIRIEGQSDAWLLQHVRAGEEVVRAEIEAAGLELVEKVTAPDLRENYFLRFVKPGKG